MYLIYPFQLEGYATLNLSHLDEPSLRLAHFSLTWHSLVYLRTISNYCDLSFVIIFDWYNCSIPVEVPHYLLFKSYVKLVFIYMSICDDCYCLLRWQYFFLQWNIGSFIEVVVISLFSSEISKKGERCDGSGCMRRSLILGQDTLKERGELIFLLALLIDFNCCNHLILDPRPKLTIDHLDIQIWRRLRLSISLTSFALV